MLAVLFAPLLDTFVFGVAILEVRRLALEIREVRVMNIW